MSDELNKVIATSLKSQAESVEILEKLVAVAQPGMVYSEPVTSGELTVITASEVSVALGFGFGSGGGTESPPAARQETREDSLQSEAGAATSSFGGGGGGGGGGVSSARPVAVIIIEPQGVRVQPVVDPTKLSLALIATVGGILVMLARMRRAARKR